MAFAPKFAVKWFLSLNMFKCSTLFHSTNLWFGQFPLTHWLLLCFLEFTSVWQTSHSACAELFTNLLHCEILIFHQSQWRVVHFETHLVLSLLRTGSLLSTDSVTRCPHWVFTGWISRSHFRGVRSLAMPRDCENKEFFASRLSPRTEYDSSPQFGSVETNQ